MPEFGVKPTGLHVVVVVGAGYGTFVDAGGCFTREEGLDDGGLE